MKYNFRISFDSLFYKSEQTTWVEVKFILVYKM